MNRRTLAIPFLLALSTLAIQPASAVAVGPCDDGGAINLALCVVETSESSACTIIYGGGGASDCVTGGADQALCPFIFGGPHCVDADAAAQTHATAGPLEDFEQCTQTGGLHGPLHCVRVLVESVCGSLGTADCPLPVAAASSLGPCDDGGAINLVLCVAQTGESAVCTVVYGGGAEPTCVADRVALIIEALTDAVCILLFGSPDCIEGLPAAA